MQKHTKIPPMTIQKNPLHIQTAIIAIILIGLVAYSNSLSGEFVFDDLVNIIENPSVRKLWPIGDALRAPLGSGLAGRPIINLSLAINYAISGEEVWSYHLLNLLIHILSALTLFGILRITFLGEKLPERYHKVSTELALGCALIWMVHPLQTQSVTYIIQRCESLMGLSFLLTMYCAIRGWKSNNPGPWRLFAFMAFLVGVGTKEVIVVAPFLIFLYDMLFVHESPKEAFKQSRSLYAWLAMGLVLLFVQTAIGGTVASGAFEVPATPFQYALTQSQVIFHYIGLSFWPHKLCLDYYWPIAKLGEAYLSAILLVGLISCSLWLVLKKKNLWGFPAIWFFAILAPTSSILPLREIIFEYRMYLPLAGLVALVVLGGYEIGRTLFSRLPLSVGQYNSSTRLLGFGLLAVTVGILAILTLNRNSDYENKIRIWADTVAKQPQNSRAQNNLGQALAESGKHRESIPYFQEAVRIKPDYFDAYSNLALAFFTLGEPEKSILPLHNAMKIKVGNPEAHFLLGRVMIAVGKPKDAIPHFIKVQEQQWRYPHLHNNLGVALSMIGKPQDAIPHFLEELKVLPDSAHVHSNLGAALAAIGKKQEAIQHFRETLRIKPDDEKGHSNLGMVLLELGRRQEAITHFREALKMNPNNTNIRNYLLKLEGR